MSWFRKKPPQPAFDPAAPSPMVPRGAILLAVTEELAALKIEPKTATLLPICLLSNLEGEEAAKEMLERIRDLMDAGPGGQAPEPSPSMAAGAQNMHSLDKVIGALMDVCVTLKLDLGTIFLLPKGVVWRLCGEAETARYVQKVEGLFEMVQAVKKMDDACR
jgi:hypothetical protein